MKGRKILGTVICLMVGMVFIGTSALAGPPTNPNGFPSGPHFNLNIHGKQANFTCPAPEYYLQVTADNNGDGDLGALVKVCDEGDVCEPTTIQAYGNSIFIPETAAGADKVRVYVESGKKGPKSAPTTAELQVTDWCAGFGGGDNEVKFRLPSNEAGYDVYARILAKPTDNPSMTFSDPGLVYAEDEDGLLVWFGILTNGGFQTTTETFTRYTGKSIAKEITGIFLWTGDVCYTQDAEGRTDTPFCQHYDAISNTYTYYPVPVEGCSVAGDIQVTLFCSLIDNQWVFNIADFVEMFYNITNNGSKLVQVRFYPRQ
jgi:hypothetical protein